jgi:hypothetical protein
MNQNGSWGETVFEIPERPVSSWRPREQNLGRGECRQEGSQGAVTPDKAAIKVGKSQETLQLQSGRRLGPIHHRSQLPGIHLYTPCSDDVTQEGDSGAMEFTLLSFHKKLVLQEPLENLSDVEHVFLGGAGENEDEVEVDKYEPVQHVTENIIHQSMEHSRGVGKVKWLPLVPFPYPHHVVGKP